MNQTFQSFRRVDEDGSQMYVISLLRIEDRILLPAWTNRPLSKMLFYVMFLLIRVFFSKGSYFDM